MTCHTSSFICHTMSYHGAEPCTGTPQRVSWQRTRPHTTRKRTTCSRPIESRRCFLQHSRGHRPRRKRCRCRSSQALDGRRGPALESCTLDGLDFFSSPDNPPVRPATRPNLPLRWVTLPAPGAPAGRGDRACRRAGQELRTKYPRDPHDQRSGTRVPPPPQTSPPRPLARPTRPRDLLLP